MKRFIHTQTILILFLMLLAYSYHIRAQVTIGSNVQASPGALLDMKEQSSSGGAANSKRGLGLPRVELTKKDYLYPMFEINPGSGTSTSGYIGANKTSQDALHTGLMIYNLNKCNGFGLGTYVWAGQQWEPLKDVRYIYQPDITVTNTEAKKLDQNTYLIHLPSGRDLRSFPTDSKFNLSLTWSDPAKGNLSKSYSSTVGSGLVFLSGSNPGNWTPVNASPVTYNYYINDMYDIIPDDNPNISDPFRSRETSVVLETPANECGERKRITVRLNQTNYRLTIKRENKYFNDYGYRFRQKSTRFTSGVNYYRFILMPHYPSSSPTRFSEQSNARWKAKYEPITSGIIDPNVVSTIIPAKGGTELINGTSVTTTREPVYISSSSANNRYKTAGVLTYTDTATVARYYPIEIHFVQCAANGYDKSNIKEASLYPEAQWGNMILSHKDQNNNTFYSANFGNAGRWMITNLAATKYDEGSGRDGEQLEVYQTIDYEEHDTGQGKYAYPIIDAGGEPANWGVKPAGWRVEEGLFYNWYAATGRTFKDNADNKEAAYGSNAFTEPAIVQGICPKGWYIPSDSEWTELEKEVNNNIGKYATYDAVDVAAFGTPAWNASWNNNTSGSYRGNVIENQHIGHGAAMKDMCPPSSTGTTYSYLQGSKGYSKDYNNGGFNVTLVGRIKATKETGSTEERKMIQSGRAWDANFWTRSQNTGGDAWFRGFQLTNGGVNRTRFTKTHLLSVRCKKR